MIKKLLNKRIIKRLLIIACVAIFLLISSVSFAEGMKKVKVGFVFGLTGPYATYGVPMKDAMDWAIEEINSKGGFEINGEKYSLDVIYYDHASKPELEGPSLVKKAIYTDKVSLLLLGGSPITRITVPFIVKEKIPTIIILAGMIGAPDKSSFLFRIRPDATQCAPPLAMYFVQKLGCKRIALIGADTDFGRDQGKMWRKTTENLGGDIIYEQWYVPGKVEDFYPMLSKIKTLNPDAIYVAGSTQQNSLIYKQAHEVGLNMPIGGYTGMTPEQAKDLIGKNYNKVMQNVYDSRGVDPGIHFDKRVKNWNHEFMQKFGYYPADLTMWAWDVPFIISQVFERAGSVSDKEKIREVLAGLTVPIEETNIITPFIGLGEDDKLFDENGQAYSLAVVVSWKDGTWLPMKYYSVIKEEIKAVVEE